MQVSLFASRVRPRPVVSLALFAGFLATPALGQVSPMLQRSAASMGEVAPSSPVSATVWLTLHNKAALDAAVQAMYTPGSSTFHKFAGTSELAQFAPTAAEIAAVKKELTAHNLQVVSIDPNNFSIKISGHASDFEAAFGTSIQQFRMKNGSLVKALSNAPALKQSGAGMVRAVSGIAGAEKKPFLKYPVDPKTNKQIGIRPLSTAKPAGATFSSECLYAPQAVTLTTPSAALPAAAYAGLIYGAPVGNTAAGTLSPCGYSPQDLYKLYDLNTAYNQGYNGAGQTIAIVDAYGSPTLTADITAFDSTYKLPALSSANFQVIVPAPITKTDAGWATETTLDVEWAHAVAPGAKIDLITTATNNNDDLQGGVLYAVEHHLANVISNSYGSPELSSDAEAITSWDEICEIAAFEGISVNFATGDDGDYFLDEGIVDVSSPADSPFATAVGGTSVATSPFDGSTVQTGWGTNYSQLASPNGVLDPPFSYGFYSGSGGGVSQYFAKPYYQKALREPTRALPDVAAIADPFTGVEVIMTVAGEQVVEVYGGTSLAAPVFSAEWALLDQRFGFPLGQAAPYIAQYGTTALVQDIVPPSMQFTASGMIVDANGQTTESADALGTPETTEPFLGALWNDGGGFEFYLTFGTDSSLPVMTGWDPVTGWGSLNMGKIFTTLGGQ